MFKHSRGWLNIAHVSLAEWIKEGELLAVRVIDSKSVVTLSGKEAKELASLLDQQAELYALSLGAAHQLGSAPEGEDRFPSEVVSG